MLCYLNMTVCCLAYSFRRRGALGLLQVACMGRCERSYNCFFDCEVTTKGQVGVRNLDCLLLETDRQAMLVNGDRCIKSEVCCGIGLAVIQSTTASIHQSVTKTTTTKPTQQHTTNLQPPKIHHSTSSTSTVNLLPTIPPPIFY